MYNSRREIDYMNMTSKKTLDEDYRSKINYENSHNYERKSNAKNLKVNRNIKRIVARGVALVAAGAIAVGTIYAVFKKHNEKVFQDNVQKIYTYYGLESDEATTLRYLDLASKFDDFDFNEYVCSTETADNLNINQSLASPSYIDLELSKFNKENADNPKNLDNLYSYLSNVAFLKGQDSLIDQYISDNAFKLVYNNYVSALKEYTAEKYNLADPGKIIFEYKVEKPGEEIITIKYDEGYTTRTASVTDKVVRDGVVRMVNLQNLLQKNPSNKKLLEEYVEALSKATEYETEVKDKDLYDESLEEKLIGR